jgi:ABC-type multidrug transport system ATPase subunit
MIRVEHLTKRFGRFAAVQDASFTVEPGDAVALWGPNGAGKTTVIRCMLGLLGFTGAISINGCDVRRRGRAARACAGYVAQELAFHDDLRVDSALAFYARLRRVSRRRGPVVLEQVGLEEHGRKRVRELSGGMKQRLALALALLSDPPVLLLDELTANLDSQARGSFLGLLRELRAAGKTIVFTSHRIDEVEVLASRVIAMRRGRVELECEPPALAQALDLRCILKVAVDPGAMQAALEALRNRSYAVTGNHRALLVEVPVTDKAGPIEVLLDRRIAVRDFELTHDGRRGRGPEGAHV